MVANHVANSQAATTAHATSAAQAHTSP